MDEESFQRDMNLRVQEIEQGNKELKQGKQELKQREDCIERKEKDLEQKEKHLDQNTTEIARRLLASGAEVKLIIESTGLTKERVMKLKQDMEN